MLWRPHTIQCNTWYHLATHENSVMSDAITSIEVTQETKSVSGPWGSWRERAREINREIE